MVASPHRYLRYRCDIPAANQGLFYRKASSSSADRTYNNSSPKSPVCGRLTCNHSHWLQSFHRGFSRTEVAKALKWWFLPPSKASTRPHQSCLLIFLQTSTIQADLWRSWSFRSQGRKAVGETGAVGGDHIGQSSNKLQYSWTAQARHHWKVTIFIHFNFPKGWRFSQKQYCLMNNNIIVFFFIYQNNALQGMFQAWIFHWLRTV